MIRTRDNVLVLRLKETTAFFNVLHGKIDQSQCQTLAIVQFKEATTCSEDWCGLLIPQFCHGLVIARHPADHKDVVYAACYCRVCSLNFLNNDWMTEEYQQYILALPNHCKNQNCEAWHLTRDLALPPSDDL